MQHGAPRLSSTRTFTNLCNKAMKHSQTSKPADILSALWDTMRAHVVPGLLTCHLAWDQGLGLGLGGLGQGVRGVPSVAHQSCLQ